MSGTTETATPATPATAERPEQVKPLDIVNLESVITALSHKFGDARKIVEELKYLDEQLRRIRERIVIWCSDCSDLNECLPYVMAYDIWSSIREAQKSLQREYYTVGEKFTPIDVEKEKGDVMPF